ncbi:hypothetical protein CN498_29555 [Bacillus thuringiensis]|nr:hypothetical protein [Bacillus cereus]MDR4369125.1 hypothetical protein [Bacillus cereus]PER81072.1 hypothetical protein CN498_29555 [Bacillus thuringiensis]PGS31815.1 hypothetical protein COC65_23235 [Bacillus thuringiensis]
MNRENRLKKTGSKFYIINQHYFLATFAFWCYPTSINLSYIFIKNAVFSYSILLSFIDVIKVGISNKP